MRHVGRIARIARARYRSRLARRGVIAQRYRRRAERIARRSAIAFTRLARRGTLARTEAARRLGVSEAALSRWVKNWRGERMRVHPRGRPLRSVSRVRRDEIVSGLWQTCGRGGVPALRARYPDAPRAELVDLHRRVRHLWRRRHRRSIRTLIWTRPGAVWAMDHAKPPRPIDGAYNRLLLERDLGSQNEIEAQPVRGEGSWPVLGSLKARIKEHGAPLVAKCDNSGAFRADEVKAFWRSHKVLQLFSPPRMPSYNGACEAGVGSIKTRAEEQSILHGRPGEWTADDVEAARRQANETGRPWGAKGPTPDEVWRARTVPTEEERRMLWASYERYAMEERATRGIAPETKLDHWAAASVDRVAISRALVECGYLEYRRRRIAPPIYRRSAGKIT